MVHVYYVVLLNMGKVYTNSFSMYVVSLISCHSCNFELNELKLCKGCNGVRICSPVSTCNGVGTSNTVSTCYEYNESTRNGVRSCSGVLHLKCL